MSRGSKYSAEEKLKIVEACLSGAIGVREAGRRVGADGKTIGRWISRYKAEGSSAFMPAERNRIYPVELKQQVVEEYLTGKGSVQNMKNGQLITGDERWKMSCCGIFCGLQKGSER